MNPKPSSLPATGRELRRELRETRKALQTLSDAALLTMHFIDTKIGPDKTVPKDVGERLAKTIGYLDWVNDTVRFGALGVNFRTDDKAKVIAKLLKQLGFPRKPAPSSARMPLDGASGQGETKEPK